MTTTPADLMVYRDHALRALELAATPEDRAAVGVEFLQALPEPSHPYTRKPPSTLRRLIKEEIMAASKVRQASIKKAPSGTRRRSSSTGGNKKKAT